MRTRVRSLASLSGLRIGIAVSCGVGGRCSLDLALLWLWHRQAAIGPVLPLAWEPPYVAGTALERQKKKERKKVNLCSEATSLSLTLAVSSLRHQTLPYVS